MSRVIGCDHKMRLLRYEDSSITELESMIACRETHIGLPTTPSHTHQNTLARTQSHKHTHTLSHNKHTHTQTHSHTNTQTYTHNVYVYVYVNVPTLFSFPLSFQSIRLLIISLLTTFRHMFMVFLLVNFFSPAKLNYFQMILTLGCPQIDSLRTPLKPSSSGSA